MGTWRGTGRRALAVGAGALLIGALGAGPAYAGTDNDDDEYTYVDDSCSDYHESWYFEHGYDYDEHWDDDWDHGDRWDKDHWDKDRDWKDRWNKGEWKDRWNKDDYYIKDGKVYDKKTNKPVFDLSTLPIQVPVQDTQTSAPDATTLGTTEQADKQADKQAADAAKQAQQEAAEKAQQQATAAAEKAQEQATAAAEKAQEQAAAAKKAQEQAAQTQDTSSSSTSTSTSAVEIPTENKAVVTDLAASDPWKDEDRDHDWDKDRDKDDHGWWDGWWEKESWTVSVSCYEDKESSHRWYDDRPVGKVEATEVKTVPKGGVNTGN